MHLRYVLLSWSSMALTDFHMKKVVDLLDHQKNQKNLHTYLDKLIFRDLPSACIIMQIPGMSRQAAYAAPFAGFYL